MKTPYKHMEAPYNVQAVSLQRHIAQGEEFCQLRQPAITVEKSVECFMLKRGTPMIPKTQYLLWKKESEDGIGYKDETTTMKKIEEKQVEKIADHSLWPIPRYPKEHQHHSTWLWLMTMSFPLASWIPHSRLRLIQGTIHAYQSF